MRRNPRLLEMARDITKEVKLLPPPIIIDTDRPAVQHVLIRGDTAGERDEFAVLKTTGEQGATFDTSGNVADSLLIDRARRFIRVHGLTGTDPESLALLARQTPALLAQLMASDDEG